MNPHLAVYISHHGFGHGAQTTSVLDALVNIVPDVRLTVVTALPDTFLRSRIRHPFQLRRNSFDFGLAMQSAFEVIREDTLLRYRELHENWLDRVNEETAWLRSVRPDAVLSNVAYLPLAAAKRAKVAAAGMSSLNWADIFCHYFPETEHRTIFGQMQDAYAGADMFIQLTPTMPMHWLPNRKKVDPVATIGHSRQKELRRRLGLDQHTKIILVSFGGIEGSFSLERWPRRDDVFWLMPHSWHPSREDMASCEELDFTFLQLMCSSDVVVTKLGYGMVSETACNGVPVIFCERGDWPEEPFLKEWLLNNNRTVFVPRSALASNQLLDAIDQVEKSPAPDRPQPTGAVEAANLLSGVINP